MSSIEKGKDLDENRINEEINEEDENENENKINEEANEDEENKKEGEKKEKKEEEPKRKDSGLDPTGNKEYEQMKEDLDKATNFIDYFLTVGMPPSIFLESWLYESDVEDLNEKFKESYQPKVTSYFPPYEKHTIAFDDSVILHCFPTGFTALKSATQPKEQIFSFILDNNYFNLNFPQKYLTCLICYENITKYKKLYDTYQFYLKGENKKNESEKKEGNNDIEDVKQKLTNLYAKKSFEAYVDSKIKDKIHTNIKLKDENIYIPKCLMIMSLYPYFAEFEKILSPIIKKEKTLKELEDQIDYKYNLII